MRRRAFIALLGGAVAWPLVTSAQQATTVARIGFLRFGPASANKERVEALRTGLRQLGYVEGKNIAIEFRWAETVEQLPLLVAELVRRKVDIIFAMSSTEVEPTRRATSTIPVVFATHADPVGLGHIASLARPGGNITGLTIILTDLVAKQLETLKQAMPHATRIGVLFSSSAPSHRPAVQAAETAGESLGVRLVKVDARTVEDIEAVFATMTRQRVDGFLDVSSPVSVSHRWRIAELAREHRLLSMFGTKEAVDAGGLMSYGADFNEMCRRAATYIDKILKGAKPADLPVEQASKYQLVINLATAKALGLTVPPALLARADEVIE
jgi:putative tryptophan/tyrosine transport system substrate-binding protein